MRRASHTRNHTRKTASSGKQKFIPPVADTTWECIVDTADVLCVYKHCCDTMKESVKSCHKLELLQKNLLWVWLNFISVQYFKWNHKLFQKIDKQSTVFRKKKEKYFTFEWILDESCILWKDWILLIKHFWYVHWIYFEKKKICITQAFEKQVQTLQWKNYGIYCVTSQIYYGMFD